MEEKLPCLIGLTGGIGSGKSSVAACLSKETGFSYFDADNIARDLFSQQGEVLDSLKKIIGGQFFHSDNTLDRAKLRETIFNNEKIRRRVEEFAHPLIWEELKKLALQDSKTSGKSIIVEVPLLFESGWNKYFNIIVVVYANRKSCLIRLAKRDKLSKAEAVLACSVQLSLTQKASLADHVIDNSGKWVDTLLKIKTLSELLIGGNNA